MRYIDLMFDALPIERIEKNNGMRIDINFLAEARYGEVLTIGVATEGDTWQFEISSNLGKTLCRSKIEFK